LDGFFYIVFWFEQQKALLVDYQNITKTEGSILLLFFWEEQKEYRSPTRGVRSMYYLLSIV